VGEAVFADGPVKPSEALSSRLKAMQGKPLDPDAFVALMRWSVQNLPTDVHALRFAVDRAGDGTGVRVKIHLFDEASADRFRFGSVSGSNDPRKVPSGWCVNGRVTVGRKHWSRGSMVCGHQTMLEDNHDEVRRGLIEGCSGPPGEPMIARVMLVAEWPK
jgi:hypothetical protein